MPELLTATKITNEILAFQKVLKHTSTPLLVKVEPRSDAIEHDCFSNVEKQISEHGGTDLHGWLIYEMKGVFLQAEFHTVWQSPLGFLRDVSENEDGTEVIVFIPDKKRRFTGGRVASEHFQLRKLASLDRFISSVRDLRSAEALALKNVPYNTEFCISDYPELELLQDRKYQAEIELSTDIEAWDRKTSRPPRSS